MLTKPDLVSPGGESVVVDTLMNRVKPLKLGYVIMRNRTQVSVDCGWIGGYGGWIGGLVESRTID